MRLRLTQEALRFLLLRLRLPFFFFSKFYARHVKSIFIFFSSCCFKRVWPGLEFLIWYAKNVGVLSNHALLIIMPFMVALLLLYLFENSNSGWSERIWNLLLPPLKRLYLYYHNAYGYQTWQGGDLPWRALAHKVIWHFKQVVVGRSRDELKSVYLPYQSLFGQETWEDGDLPWGASTPKITWRYDHVVLWDHMAN